LGYNFIYKGEKAYFCTAEVRRSTEVSAEPFKALKNSLCYPMMAELFKKWL